MYYFLVPEPITPVNSLTKRPAIQVKSQDTWKDQRVPEYEPAPEITADGFVMQYILSSGAIGRTNGKPDSAGRVARRVRKIESAFDGCKPGDFVALDLEEVEKISEVLTSLAFDDPRYGAQMLPFIEALEKISGQDEDWKRKQTIKAVPDEKTEQ